MQQALGLMGDQAIMMSITFALGIGGIAALLMALFWPRRWQLPLRMEIGFVALLAALAVYADVRSGQTYAAYEADLPDQTAVSGQLPTEGEAAFDRVVKVYAFQWGFAFIDQEGAVSRNAVKVAPGERVLFTILANDVIHGLNIPVARLTTEVEPGDVRSVWIRAPDEPGKYLIQCLNYCGLGHAQMKAWLVVEGAGEHEGEGHARGEIREKTT